jgi:hypothetical protein
LHLISVRVLDDFCSISGRNFMSDHSSSVPDPDRFGGLVNNFPPKLSRKFKLLLPHKDHIAGLLAKRASYDDIRVLLKEASIVVSKNTVYRFCRAVIGQKQARQPGTEKKEIPKTVPVLPSPTNQPVSIQAALQEQRRERLPGLWGRRKRGPRIADSKNL